MKRSYYSETIDDFLLEDEHSIIGKLSIQHSFALEDLQKNSWIQQIRILKSQLKADWKGWIFFEFSIPRMGRRVDNVLIINDIIYVIEFKVGETEYPKHALDQVIDYSLDLLNFHEGSHSEKLLPILVSTDADSINSSFQKHENLFEVLKANSSNIGELIYQSFRFSEGKTIDAVEWSNSLYKPTPTIVEAAQALYRGHNVKEISRHDAGAINLSRTADCINQIIDNSKTNNRKSICFLTGVPGAGKTLAGLNVANERTQIDKNEHAVFLSGNGPLVAVLKEALTRDKRQLSRESGISITRQEAESQTHSLIQNIHHFRDDQLLTDNPPIERVVIYDEAQRAWTKEKTQSFMKQKKGKPDFNLSEPEFLIGVLGRHETWCTLICLIGGGQEINDGEAGLSEWIFALKDQNSDWDTYYSDKILSDENYLGEESLIGWLRSEALPRADLHLAVSVRSFRSELVSDLMQKVVVGDSKSASDIYKKIERDYPVVIARNADVAKRWLREKARGSERIGIVASSGGRRLKSMGMDVKNNISPAHWFLEGKQDVRSSYFLEDIATEFDIQGLEIDYVCVAWDINMYYEDYNWNYQSFSGSKWQKIKKAINVRYLQNAYRVLLTRARQGVVIFIPNGDHEDETRPPLKYEGTYEFFKSCGFQLID